MGPTGCPKRRYRITNLRWVRSQKNPDLVCTSAEAWNHTSTTQVWYRLHLKTMSTFVCPLSFYIQSLSTLLLTSILFLPHDLYSNCNSCFNLVTTNSYGLDMSTFRFETNQDFGGRWCLRLHGLTLRTRCLHVRVELPARLWAAVSQNTISRPRSPHISLQRHFTLNSPAAVITSSQSGCRRGAGARAALCSQMFAVNWELRPCAVATVWLSRSGKPYRRPSAYPTTGWPQLASSADSPQTRGRLYYVTGTVIPVFETT